MCVRGWGDGREGRAIQILTVMCLVPQDTLFGLLDKHSAGDSWIGLRGMTGDWHWVTGRNISHHYTKIILIL